MKSEEDIQRAIESIDKALEEKRKAIKKSECPQCGRSGYASTEPIHANTRAKAIKEGLQWALDNQEKVSIGTLNKVLDAEGRT